MDEAKIVLDGVESMVFQPEEFHEIYSLLKEYTTHKNWRVRN